MPGKKFLTTFLSFTAIKASVSSGLPPSPGWYKKGVLLGFWYGNRLKDTGHYLTHGTNKQIFYKIFYTAEEIDQDAIVKLLQEAVQLDNSFKKLSNK